MKCSFPFPHFGSFRSDQYLRISSHLKKKHNFESKIRQIHDFSDFVGTQRNEGNRDMNGQITFLTNKIIIESQEETLLSMLLPGVIFEQNSKFE